MSVIARPLNFVEKITRRIPGRFKFVVFLGTCVFIAVIMTVISYYLYVVSGAASLDLSRPGYKQALTEVNTAATNEDYSISAVGPLSKDVLTQFKNEFHKQTALTKTNNAYSDEALSDDNLNLFVNVAGSQ